MKKIIIFSCLFVFIFNVCVLANESSELDEIKAKLENKTIENYETILIPLNGDPENFNIQPTDDLKTIRFGEGVVGYGVNYDEIMEASENGDNQVSEYLDANGSYYFPVIVSDRAVATVEVVKTDTGYKVLCVASGSISDHFIEAQQVINLNNAKYVKEANIIDGFVVTENGNEYFIDLDSVENEVGIQTVNSNHEQNVVELCKSRIKSTQNDGQDITGGGGKSASTNKPLIAISGVLIIMIVGGILIFKKKRRYN